MVAYRHLRVVLHGEIEIAEKVFAYLRVFSVVKCDGPLNEAPFPELAEYLRQYPGAFFGLLFIRIVIVDIQIVCSAFYRLQLRVTGEDVYKRQAEYRLGAVMRR